MNPQTGNIIIHNFHLSPGEAAVLKQMKLVIRTVLTRDHQNKTQWTMTTAQDLRKQEVCIGHVCLTTFRGLMDRRQQLFWLLVQVLQRGYSPFSKTNCSPAKPFCSNATHLTKVILGMISFYGRFSHWRRVLTVQTRPQVIQLFPDSSHSNPYIRLTAPLFFRGSFRIRTAKPATHLTSVKPFWHKSQIKRHLNYLKKTQYRIWPCPTVDWLTLHWHQQCCLYTR